MDNELLERAAYYFYTHHTWNEDLYSRELLFISHDYVKFHDKFKELASEDDIIIFRAGNNNTHFGVGCIRTVSGRACYIKPVFGYQQKVVKWCNIIELRKENIWNYNKLITIPIFPKTKVIVRCVK